MFKKILFVLLSVIFITGCGDKTNEKNSSINQEKHDNLIIKTKITNESEKDASYLVFLMPVGLRNEEAGKANQSGYYGPFETNENGEVEIDLKYNRDINYYINSKDNEKPNSLEIFITTKEDKYIRNPLNKKTILEFIKNDTDEEYPEVEYYSSVSELEVPFTDKYPDGVLSLTFQDASFVIKFKFEDDFVPTNSYETSIFWNDPSVPSGIGIVRVGRINREFQYWDTPFFKTDNLASKTGTIVVTNFDTNKQINYLEYPKVISFDKNGKSTTDDIITITIPKP